MDVVGTAWMGAGRPIAADLAAVGTCARCSTAGQLVPVRQVVSYKFTAFDSWRASDGGLCAACTWAYRTPELRAGALLVRREPPELTFLPLLALRDVLRQPLAPDAAACVPRRAGRKHILPGAQWGRVALDDVLLAWTAPDCQRLELVERMRALGCPAGALGEFAPPWKVVGRLGGAERSWLMGEWASLDVWRRRRPWLDLALLATTSV